ncbi:MAG TPA: hypothetical protein VF018_06090 [Acidobacteriaceae bacterium]
MTFDAMRNGETIRNDATVLPRRHSPPLHYHVDFMETFWSWEKIEPGADRIALSAVPRMRQQLPSRPLVRNAQDLRYLESFDGRVAGAAGL